MEASRGTILLVANTYPPRPSSASVRPWGLSKYLTRLGYRVIVLTSGAWGTAPAERESAARVIRTRDLFSTRLNWRRRNVAAFEGRAQRAYTTQPSLMSRLMVPDVAMFTWLPFALPAALRIARQERIDCVLTTSGPESTNLIGLALRKRGIPWVADMRDGWRFEAYRSWQWPVLEWIDGGLESLTLRRADRVVTVSDPISEDLRRRLGANATTIPNGYDPDETNHEAPTGNGLLDPGRHSLVHTGSLASGGRSPAPMLAALRLLAERSPEELRRIEVVFAGPVTLEEQRQLTEARLSGSVRHVGSLERPEALHLQRDADSLLVMTAGSRRGEATGKVFEYLSAAHPILVLGDETEAARIVTHARAGVAVPLDDPERIAEALVALVRGETRLEDAAAVERARVEYSHPRMAERMAEVIEEARAGA